MTNRKGLPSATKKGIKLKQHEVLALRKNDNVMVLAWKDKRVVTMLSTVHNNTVETITRTGKRGEEEQFSKPKVIIEYTKKMGAVDRAGHYCSSYSFTRKSLKWWRKLFFWLLEVAIVNSFTLMNLAREEENLKPLKHKVFRKALITQLVGSTRNKTATKRGRPSSTDKEERLNDKPHFIQLNPKKSTKDCAVCSDRKTKGERRETLYFCETCSRKPGLHPGECFKKYHTLQKYR